MRFQVVLIVHETLLQVVLKYILKQITVRSRRLKIWDMTLPASSGQKEFFRPKPKASFSDRPSSTKWNID